MALPTPPPVGLAVRHLLVLLGAVDAEQPPPRILNNLLFDTPAGSVMAIMGGSGAGKTTLLNVLLQRLTMDSGKLSFGGEINYTTPDGSALESVRSAYLLQTNAFLPGLLVRETLEYAAQLRFPAGTSATVVSQEVSLLLDKLLLLRIADHVISLFSNPEHTSLSGGEQRRVSLAIQLLSRPSVLFLDEPTTGLDSASSLQLMDILKALAHEGMTVIMAIHQPRFQILQQLDLLCLLAAGGRMVFHGLLLEATEYFDHVADGTATPSKEVDPYQAGAHVNAVDLIMDMTVKNSATAAEEKLSSARIDRLVARWHERVAAVYPPVEQTDEEAKAHFRHNMALFAKKVNLPLWHEIMVTTRRNWVLTVRDYFSLVALNGGSIILAVCIGWFFYKQKLDLKGIRAITSSLYSLLEVLAFLPLYYELIRLFAMDGPVFDRERREHVVLVTGFLVLRRLARFLLEDLPVALLYAVITYFMVGLGNSNGGGADRFFVYFAVSLLINCTGIAMLAVLYAILGSFAEAQVWFNMIYQVQNLGSGFFVNADTMPVYVRWVKYVAFFWYSFNALALNQFSDFQGNCGADVCPEEYSGKYILDTLGVRQHYLTVPIIVTFAWFIGFSLITWAFLMYRLPSMKMAGKSKKRTDAEEEDVVDSGSTVDLGVEVEKQQSRLALVLLALENVDMHVSSSGPVALVKRLFGTAPSPHHLLNHVSATFCTGQLNAIMGPLGLGKTTLLNLLADRLLLLLKYVTTGDIVLGHRHRVAPSGLGKYAAYVIQLDDNLSPHLTVRETLEIQTQLRFPHILRQEIGVRVETLVRQMGLVDCVDNLVGNADVKGISGGEKRRVLIAIQLLLRPQLLLLDEPTLGLDSHTALVIVNLLLLLASDYGTTVIFTVHQPKQEMFDAFGTVLLLARGGRVVYNGTPRGVGPHMASAGLALPPHTSTADFVLDVVTPSAAEGADALQKRVDRLVELWKTESPKAGLSSPVQVETSEETLREEYGLETFKQLLFLSTFRVVLYRTLITQKRSWDVLVLKVAQLVLFGVCLALFFAPAKHGPTGISDRLGLIQEVLMILWIGCFNNLSMYPQERNLFHAEYRDGTYGALTFNLSYVVQELPFEFLSSVVFSALAVMAVGLPRTPSMFFIAVYCCTALMSIGELLGIIFNLFFLNPGLAVCLVLLFLTLGTFMGGTMLFLMPVFFKAWNWINGPKYSTGVFMMKVFENETFRCGAHATSCQLDLGRAVLETYGVDVDIPVYLGALFVCAFLNRVVACLTAWYRAKYML